MNEFVCARCRRRIEAESKDELPLGQCSAGNSPAHNWLWGDSE